MNLATEAGKENEIYRDKSGKFQTRRTTKLHLIEEINTSTSVEYNYQLHAVIK